MKTVALITAAGKGTRLNLDKNKLLIKINGQTIIEKTVNKFYNSKYIDSIIITANKNDIDLFNNIFSNLKKPVKIVEGGINRTISVKNGLNAINFHCDIILIHDGARPFVSDDIIYNCIENVKINNSAITAIPITDTIKKADNNKIISTIDRNNIYSIQTPQGFYYKDILKAYSKIKENENFTDDSSVYEKYIAKPYICLGDLSNIKITYKKDLQAFNKENLELRSGIGYDSHKFADDRKFILGGTEIPYEKGLYGYSDADALLHAIIDSLLSAAGLLDIGTYFPETDKQYKDINSLILLKKCNEILNEKGYTVNNISAMINCEKPKLAKYIPDMKKNIANVLNISIDKIGISAKTNEHMGFSGRGEGVFVIANSTIKSNG